MSVAHGSMKIYVVTTCVMHKDLFLPSNDLRPEGLRASRRFVCFAYASSMGWISLLPENAAEDQALLHRA